MRGPKKTPAGYVLAMEPPVETPGLRWRDGAWELTEEWATWATTTRAACLAELLANPAWFSRPPRADLLSPLFGPWVGTAMSGARIFTATPPPVPGDARSGTATWLLKGLLMTSTAIQPTFAVGAITPDKEDDRISLFGEEDGTGDGDTMEGGGGGGEPASEEEIREIHLEDMPDSPEGGAATTLTRIRSREWEARKFLAKERVREARLKAQITERLADTEERRFYAQFGDLDDGESRFSDYDLTDEDGTATEASEESA